MQHRLKMACQLAHKLYPQNRRMTRLTIAPIPKAPTDLSTTAAIPAPGATTATTVLIVTPVKTSLISS